jgi:hypothetical protein
MGAKPSKGTPKDKRLKANKPGAGKKSAFGGKKANPFTKKKP